MKAITNPYTGRPIKVGGPTYNKIFGSKPSFKVVKAGRTGTRKSRRPKSKRGKRSRHRINTDSEAKNRVKGMIHPGAKVFLIRNGKKTQGVVKKLKENKVKIKVGSQDIYIPYLKFLRSYDSQTKILS